MQYGTYFSLLAGSEEAVDSATVGFPAFTRASPLYYIYLSCVVVVIILPNAVTCAALWAGRQLANGPARQAVNRQ